MLESSQESVDLLSEREGCGRGRRAGGREEGGFGSFKIHTRVCSKTQFVFASLTSDTKEVVLGVSCFSGSVF